MFPFQCSTGAYGVGASAFLKQVFLEHMNRAFPTLQIQGLGEACVKRFLEHG
jgi:hypothetical protein